MGGALVRIWASVRKEILSVLRQPRLVMTLIIGPFLILVLFGLGYRDRPEAFRTELVLPNEQARLAGEDLSDAFGSNIELVGISHDVEAAQARLRRGELDMVIVAPDDALETIRRGVRADFVVTHNEVDPVLRATINLLSRLSIDEINRQVLIDVIARAQEDAAALAHLQEIAGELARALGAGNDAEEQLDTGLEQATSVPPRVLVSPFNAEISEVSRVPGIPAVFYGPGALALLLQHLAVTFAALSLVRERELGLAEVFRVSPLGVSEALAGKYLAFTTIAGTVAVALTGAMILFGARVEDLWMYAGVLLLMILASLGLGFVVSAFARTDNQAVQYSMMILLVSIFFTGFVLPLEQLVPPVRVLSFLLPATYGILAMHDLMFRAAAIDPELVAGLAGYSAVLAALALGAVRQVVAKPD